MTGRRRVPGVGSNLLIEAAWSTCHPNGRLRDTRKRADSGRETVTLPVPQSMSRKGCSPDPNQERTNMM